MTYLIVFHDESGALDDLTIDINDSNIPLPNHISPSSLIPFGNPSVNQFGQKNSLDCLDNNFSPFQWALIPSIFSLIHHPFKSSIPSHSSPCINPDNCSFGCYLEGRDDTSIVAIWMI